MTQAVRRWIRLLGTLAVVLSAAPASAQITVGSQFGLANPGGPSSSGFDSVNQVYLVVSYGNPIIGQFLYKDGVAIGSTFVITSEANETGWATVAFGGPPEDPVFLVAYLSYESSAVPKYGRLIRYRPGSAPLVSDRTHIADVTSAWFAAEKSQSIWDGTAFIVGTTVNGGVQPVGQIQHFYLNGTVSSATILGDYLDAENARGLACSPAGDCVAVGWAYGIPWGSIGGVWARAFSASTLQPSGGLFYVDNHIPSGVLIPQNQAVIYNTYTGRFLTSWERAGYVENRLVDTDGALGPAPDSSRNFGPGVGESHIVFNDLTGTTLLLTKAFSESNLYALELGDDGTPRNRENVLETIPWDGQINEFTASVAADPVNARWIVTARLAGVGGVAKLVSGTPDPSRVGVSSVSPRFGPLTGGTVVTIKGRNFQSNATVVVGDTPATNVTVVSDSEIRITMPGAPAGKVNIVVTNGDLRTGTLYGGYTYVPPQLVTVYLVGGSGGTVTAGGGISCPGTCSAIYQPLATVTLTAAPAPGYTFGGFGGDSDCADGSLTISNTNKYCTAMFVPFSRSVDFDRNGRSDLVWRNATTGQNVVWMMSGTTLKAQMPLPIVSNADWDLAAAADMDGDGRPDLVWHNASSGATIVWVMNDTSIASMPTLPAEPDTNWRIVAAADMDNDGDADLIWRNISTGENRVWVMNGTTFVRAESLPALNDTNWQIVGAQDVDLDCRIDLVWRNTATGEDIVWYLDGTTFLSRASLPTVTDTNWQIQFVADINGDVKPDLVWRNVATGLNVVWYLDGVTFLGQEALPTLSDVNWGILWHVTRPPRKSRDFDGDGKPDLVWHNLATGQNIVWLMDGPTCSSQISLPTVSDTTWRTAGTGDFSGDGKPDIIWRNASTGQNKIWVMNGTTFVSEASLPTVADTSWQIVGAADFDGDAKPDLVWRNNTTGMNVLWLMDGVAFRSQIVLPSVGDTTWQVVAVADTDADGKPDLVWRNTTSGANVVWRMNGTSYVSQIVLPAVADTSWAIVMAADFNGDGRADLVWRNFSTGVNVLWYMNGSTIAGQASLLTVADPAWTIR